MVLAAYTPQPHKFNRSNKKGLFGRDAMSCAVRMRCCGASSSVNHRPIPSPAMEDTTLASISKDSVAVLVRKQTRTSDRLIYPLVTSSTDNSQATSTSVGYFRREFLQWALLACDQKDFIPSLDKS
jgi:hypothetical protein